MLEQPASGGLYPVERAHAGEVLEELQPVGRTCVREICEGLYPVESTPCLQSVRRKERPC